MGTESTLCAAAAADGRVGQRIVFKERLVRARPIARSLSSHLINEMKTKHLADLPLRHH
jgi:hypothetical protein